MILNNLNEKEYYVCDDKREIMVKEDLFFDELNVNDNYIIQKDSKYIVIVRVEPLLKGNLSITKKNYFKNIINLSLGNISIGIDIKYNLKTKSVSSNQTFLFQFYSQFNQ